MMLIDVRADRSPIHGLGLFSVHAIPAGTPVWRYQVGFDQSFGPEALAGLPEPARRHLRHYGYLDASSGRWVLNGDLTIFMNHAEAPNTGAGPENPSAGQAPVTVALRDIAAGEELTCNYHAFDGAEKPITPESRP